MPKAKIERVVREEDGFQVVEVDVAGGGETKATKTVTMRRPTAQKLTELVTVLGNEKKVPLTTFFLGSDYEGKDTGEETMSQFLARMVGVAIDKRIRADAYESVAQESTTITVGKDKIDLMSFKLKGLLRAINGARGVRAERMAAVGIEDPDSTELTQEQQDKVKTGDRGLGYGPYKTAAKNLVEGYVNDKGEKVPPQARENKETGLLEAIAA